MLFWQPDAPDLRQPTFDHLLAYMTDAEPNGVLQLAGQHPQQPGFPSCFPLLTVQVLVEVIYTEPNAVL